MRLRDGSETRRYEQRLRELRWERKAETKRLERLSAILAKRRPPKPHATRHICLSFLDQRCTRENGGLPLTFGRIAQFGREIVHTSVVDACRLMV